MNVIAILCVTHILGIVDCIEYSTLEDCRTAESLVYRPAIKASTCDNFTIDRESVAPLSSPLPVARP